MQGIWTPIIIVGKKILRGGKEDFSRGRPKKAHAQ